MRTFALALLLCTPLAAQDFSRSVAFGDSLIANPVSPLHGADPVTLMLGQVVQAPGREGAQLAIYARGGSSTAGLMNQIGAYAAAQWPAQAATFITIASGGGDMLALRPQIEYAPPGWSPAIDAAVAEVMWNLACAIVLMWQAHPTAEILVWTVPDITDTPRWYHLRATPAGANIRAHTKRVNDWLRLLHGAPRCHVYDLELAWRDRNNWPPFMIGTCWVVRPPGFGVPHALFADGLHPTAWNNAVMANDLLNSLSWPRGVPRIPLATYVALAGC